MAQSNMHDMPEDYWRQKLTPAQYHALREKGTEVPGSGKWLNNTATGMYTCAACATRLFDSDTKYESTTPGLIGWPSFSDAAESGSVELSDDNSMWMRRTEVTCKTCGGHLGHLFPDDASPNGKHYCINSDSLDFSPKK